MWRERHEESSPTYDRWLRAGGWRLVAAAGSGAAPQVALAQQ
jgi:hypothetical protein